MIIHEFVLTFKSKNHFFNNNWIATIQKVIGWENIICIFWIQIPSRLNPKMFNTNFYSPCIRKLCWNTAQGISENPNQFYWGQYWWIFGIPRDRADDSKHIMTSRGSVELTLASVDTLSNRFTKYYALCVITYPPWKGYKCW